MDFYRDETSAPRLLEYMGMNTDAYFQGLMILTKEERTSRRARNIW